MTSTFEFLGPRVRGDDKDACADDVMDRLIYTALTGMRARTAAQAVTANNLTNAGVTGFRRELSSLASRYITGPAGSTVNGLATGSRVQADDAVTSASTDPGHVTPTGQPLDVAVDGAGWIAARRRTATRHTRGAATFALPRRAASKPVTAIR